MEIDCREIPEGERLDRAMAAIPNLGADEVLTLLLPDDPTSLGESLVNVLGTTVDVQILRWGLKDLPWLLHVKSSKMASAYQPEA